MNNSRFNETLSVKLLFSISNYLDAVGGAAISTLEPGLFQRA